MDPLTFGSMAFIPSSSFAVRISSPLLQSPNELGANFFFAKYVFNGHPFAISHRNWLAKCYLQDCPGPLGAAIEAAGMAGISNISDSLHLAYKSKERYRDAVAAAKQALDDPAQAADDVTLMAVILLGLYEVQFDSFFQSLYLVDVSPNAERRPLASRRGIDIATGPPTSRAPRR